MLADEFTDFVRNVPFRPYRIMTSDGHYEIKHTDFALVLDDSVIVFFPEKEADFERSILVSLTHIIRIEFIDDDPRGVVKRKRRRK